MRHGLDIKATVFTWSITTDIRANLLSARFSKRVPGARGFFSRPVVGATIIPGATELTDRICRVRRKTAGRPSFRHFVGAALLPSAHSLLTVIQYIAAQASLFRGIDLTSGYRFEVTVEMTECAIGQEDCPPIGMRVHQCSRIHCVTPDSISKFLLPNNPCYYTAGVNADADIPAGNPSLLRAILVRPI